MAEYLSRELIYELKTALVEAGLVESDARKDLLHGIHPGYAAALPTRSNPLLQIWSDLEDMNSVAFLEDSQVPLRIWLSNATHFLKITGRPEQALFQKALDQVVMESEHRLKAVGGVGAHPDPVSREYYLDLLRNFLRPLQGVLHLTQQIFDGLRDQQDLLALELRPKHLQAYFAALPDSDPRKYLWALKIEELQEQNRLGGALVEKYYGRIVLDEFREVCDKYRHHVKDWAIVWQHLKDEAPLDDSSMHLDNLWSPRFPAGMEAALDKEIALVKQRAGEI